ncbi:SH3 domain and tetratricopeptide repeat-containing protein 2 isoform X3 [Sceloporus undulatus]|uniref:SH3 domain and tetratricopeptide repeat-containing protein 2 isoform X3 n=1 Tax=Sceloporus undulatus TaxID=8520 RepID=UPI001C4AC88F|nr:SH3 domain and tetratricopeptide repeat-containing protein 2 isoform X3 [Sceloporus undulatus]
MILELTCMNGEESSSSSSAQPAFLASWSNLQQYSEEPREKCFQKEKMASGNPRELDPGSQPAQIGEGILETESVSLAVGEGFPNEIALSFTVKSRSGQGHNPQLQEAARKKLWALENDDKDVCALFKELSARLVSIQAQDNRFLLSFRTVEEIWKFSTYLALGYVGCCLEHLLFTSDYWLNCALVEDTEITVTVDEDHMTTMYLGLLLQEGNFFARAVFSVLVEEKEEDLKLCKNELVHVKDVGHETKWEGISLLTDQRGLVSVTAIEPLAHPFYQWFLKNYPLSCGISNQVSGADFLQIGQGKCTAIEDHRGRGWDELSFYKDDIIEVIGFLIPGLQWFIGKSTSSGTIGFVQSKCVTAETDDSIHQHRRKSSVFFSEEEASSFLQVPWNGSEMHYSNLLHEWAETDIASVYRLDGFEPVAMYPQTPSGEYVGRGKWDTFCVPAIYHLEEKYLLVPYLSLSGAVVEGLKDGWMFEGWGKHSSNNLSTPSDSEQSSPVGESSPSTLELLLPEPDDLDDPKFFIDLNIGHMEDCDVFDPILTFLNQSSYVTHFQSLYDLSFSFLSSTFYGFSSEEELVLYLETSRNWAKRGQLDWAHIRICFLLGRLCVKRAKFSQARVYFEEAMNTMDHGFEDLPLLTSLHINLAAIYLKQKMKQKFLSVVGKGVALLACLPGHCFSSDIELEVVLYILREAMAMGNTALEARACLLVVKLFLQLGKYDEVLPFAERLQCLCASFSSQDSTAASLDTMPILTYLYDKKYLPHIALASARLFSPNSIKGALTPIWRAGFILSNSSKFLKVQERSTTSTSTPALACLYLNHALVFSHENGAMSTERALCAVLSKMYLKHGLLQGAVHYSNRAVLLGKAMGEEEAFESSLFLGWMHTLNSQPEKAVEIMMHLLHSLQQTDGVTQDGVVHNLLAIALKGEGHVQKAAENYLWALNKARETGNRRNQAIALSNFGCLAVSCRANCLAGHYFIQAIELYFDLQGGDDVQLELVQILLWLAQTQVAKHKVEESKLFYELALAVALKTRSVMSQLHATESLCHFYSEMCPNTEASIIYHEHQVLLAQQLQDREMEGQLLQSLQQLYQSVNTARSLKQALDCTKQSLKLFIDMEETVKTAQAWLQAGQLYYQLQEDELVEMYLQAAIETALKPEELHLAMELYEEAGDVFFNGIRNRQRAVEYYRGGAVPLARKLKDPWTELRLFNKLAELQIGLQNYENALEFATLAARLSVDVGDQWQEVVAFHRLATAYYLLQMYEMAEDCYLRTLSLRSPLLQGTQEAMYYSKVYCRLGDLTLCKLKDEQDATNYFLLALAAATELDDQAWQGRIQARLAQIYNASHSDKSPRGWTTYRARWLSEGRQDV